MCLPAPSAKAECLLIGCGPTASYLFCFAKKGNPKKATALRCPPGSRLCGTKNGKALKLAFGSDSNAFLSIFCTAQSAAKKRKGKKTWLTVDR